MPIIRVYITVIVYHVIQLGLLRPFKNMRDYLDFRDSIERKHFQKYFRLVHFGIGNTF